MKKAFRSLSAILLMLMVTVYCSVACTHMNSATILNRINDHYNALTDIQSGDKQELTANGIKTVKDLFIYYRDYFADVETYLSKNDSRHCVEQLRSITNNNLIFDDQYASKAANQLEEMYDKQLKLNGQFDFGLLGIEMSNLVDSEQVINIKYADCRAYSIERVIKDSCAPENAIGKITLFDTKISKEWLSSHSIDQIVEIGNDNAKICCCIQCLDTSSIEIYILSETSALGIEKDLTTIELPIGIISIPLTSGTTDNALTVPVELSIPYILPTQQNETPCAHGEHLFVPDHCCKCGYTPRTIDDDLVVGWFLFTNRQSIEYAYSVDPFDGIVYIPETYKQTIIKEVHMSMMRDEIEEIILPKTVSLIDITANQPTQNDTTTVKRIVIYGNDDLHIEHISDLQQLTDIVIDPNRKISCGNGCFRNCTSLSKVTLPSIEIIAQDMFENCSSLKDIVIQNTLKEISWGAFSGCSSLQAIHYSGTTEQWRKVDISKGVGNPRAITVYCSNGTATI